MALHLHTVCTTEEALAMLDKNYRHQLTGKGRIAEQYNISTGKIGGTRYFLIEDVRRAAKSLDAQTGPGQDISPKTVAALQAAAEARVDRVVAQLKQARPATTTDQYYTSTEACEILGGISRSRLYTLSDFNGGPIPTIEFGRVRLYEREVVDARAIELGYATA